MEVALELGNSRGQRSFEVHARKSLDCCEGTVGRNIDIKGDSGKVSGRKDESYRGSLCCLREYIPVITINRMLVEIQTLKVILVKS